MNDMADSQRATLSAPQREPSSVRWSWRYTGFLSLLLAALLFGRSPEWLLQPVWIVDPPSTAWLAPDWAWSPVLNRWAGASQVLVWPAVFAACIAAALFAGLGRWVSGRIPGWSAMALVLGLTLQSEPHDLWPAVVLTAMVSALASSAVQRRPWRGAWVAVAGVSAACLASLEFGIVGLVGGGLLLAHTFHSRAGTISRWIPLASVVGLLGGVAWFEPGFRAALLRPWSVLWSAPPHSLLASSGPVFTQPDWRGAHLALVCFQIDQWRQSLAAASPGGALFGLRLLLSAQGLACAHYLPLCSLAGAVLPTQSVSHFRDSTRLRTGLLVLVALMAAWQWSSQSQRLSAAWSGAPERARRLNPAAWGIAGPVLLMNLDQAPEWTLPQSGAGQRLIIDDRWDLFGGDYSRYSRVCADLAHGRSESYRLEDGRWGGYLSAVRNWSPGLLVVDSNRGAAIRDLSLSPHWKVLGMDSRRTIFGRAEDPRILERARYASQILAGLEWPVRPTLDNDVLAVSTTEDQVRAAAVLTALRLPYAALRLLPDQGGSDVEDQRTWCYLELAHRALRYSGCRSLLDQFRAVSRFRRGLEAGRWSSAERARIERALAGIAVEESWSAEDAARRALLGGDSAALEEAAKELEPSAAEFYRLLGTAAQRTAADVYDELQRQLVAERLPLELRGEAAYYLGCLAIEAGDATSAARWLSVSETLDPQAGYAPLRRFHLQKLSTP